MGLFSKVNYTQFELPFYVETELTDDYSGVNIEAYGKINDTIRYFYTSYTCKNDDMAEEIYTSLNKDLTLLINIDLQNLDKFKVNLKDLAIKANNKNIEKLSFVDCDCSIVSSIK